MESNISTGDVLLFSGNNFTSFLVKFFTSSKYSHVAVAIRIDEDNKVSIDNNKRLCVLDINLKPRYDIISKKLISGIALVDYKDLQKEYNVIDVRHIKKNYINSMFKTKVQKFIDNHRDINYSFSIGPIVGVWIGCPISGIKRSNKEMICSELVAYFYSYVCGFSPTIEKPARLYRPNDFIYPYTKIFSGKEYTVYIRYLDANEVLLTPLIIGILMIIIVIVSLPKSFNKTY